MLAWTRRQIERGHLNSKSLSKSFSEFSRRVYEQEVGKGKGIKPMESFSLQTLTFNNELPRLPPSTPGEENFLRKGTREALKARRGIQSQTSTGTDTALAEGDGPLCPPEQQAAASEERSHFALLLLFFGWVFLIANLYSTWI